MYLQMKAAAHVTQLSATMPKPQYVRYEIPNKFFYYELRKNYIIVQQIPNIYVLIANIHYSTQLILYMRRSNKKTRTHRRKSTRREHGGMNERRLV